MEDKKYKKPLKQTKHIDHWKCPWCRNVIYETPSKMTYSNFDVQDGEFEEECPECGKKSSIFLSVMYIVEPITEE